jgi:hypothetical protein
MPVKRKLKTLVFTALFIIFCVAPAGLVVYAIFNPAFYLGDAVAEYPAPDTPQLTEAFALACAEQIIAQANLAGELEPFEDDRADPGDRYLLRHSPTSGTIMFVHKTLGGARFVNIDLIDGTAHCELWRGK